jgi:hypothetical protein
MATCGMKQPVGRTRKIIQEGKDVLNLEYTSLLNNFLFVNSHASLRVGVPRST